MNIRLNLLKYFGEYDALRNIYFWLIVLLFLLIHISLSILFEDINFIGSFGAILTVFGLLTSFTHSLYPNFKNEIQEPYIAFNGIFTATNHTQTDWFKEQDCQFLPDPIEAVRLNNEYNVMITNKYKGIITTYFVTIFGTLIWAYAGYFQLT